MNKLLIALVAVTLAASAAQAGDPARPDAPVPATRHVPLLDAYRAEAPLAQTPAAAWAESNRIVAGQQGMAHGGHQMHGMHDMHSMPKPDAAPASAAHDHAAHGQAAHDHAALQPGRKPPHAGKPGHGGYQHGGHRGQDHGHNPGHDMKEHKQ